MEKIIASCLIFGLVALFIEENMSMPGKRLLLFDCDEKLTCDKLNDTDTGEVCGSDGKTYASECHVNMENQKNYCEVGNFNPITVAHTGICTATEEKDGDDFF